MIKTISKEQQPREKAIYYGIDTLSNEELLAIILRTGNKQESCIELSKRLIDEIGGFEQLLNIDYSSLVSIKGIKKAKAIALLSIIELSKRLKENHINYKIKYPIDIYNLVKDELMMLKQEYFILICLDNRNQVIKKKTLFIGSLVSSVVSPREVFKEAVSVSSAKIALCHNHPSGDSSPSLEDLHITHQIEELGKMMGIEVIEHLIIGWNEFYSIKGDYKQKIKN